MVYYCIFIEVFYTYDIEGRQFGMNPDAILEKVKDVIVEQLGVEDDTIKLDTSFIDDLGADSLDIVELIMALEEEFDMQIPDGDAEKIISVELRPNYEIEVTEDTKRSFEFFLDNYEKYNNEALKVAF